MASLKREDEIRYATLKRMLPHPSDKELFRAVGDYVAMQKIYGMSIDLAVVIRNYKSIEGILTTRNTNTISTDDECLNILADIEEIVFDGSGGRRNQEEEEKEPSENEDEVEYLEHQDSSSEEDENDEEQNNEEENSDDD